jgi:hypothetical protein
MKVENTYKVETIYGETHWFDAFSITAVANQLEEWGLARSEYKIRKVS